MKELLELLARHDRMVTIRFLGGLWEVSVLTVLDPTGRTTLLVRREEIALETALGACAAKLIEDGVKA